jgi:hypothetical protein
VVEATGWHFAMYWWTDPAAPEADASETRRPDVRQAGAPAVPLGAELEGDGLARGAVG